MNIEIIEVQQEFEPFVVRIEVNDKNELFALAHAAARICNGHGTALYAALAEKCQQFGVKL